MHPDNQINRDLLILTALLAIMLLTCIAFTFTGSTYTHADHCANRVREAISPYQVKQLINSRDLPPSYEEVKSWCSHQLDDYEHQINQAKTYQEYPRTPDMI